MNARALHVFTVTADSVTAAVAQSNCHGGITVCAGLWYCPVVVCRMLAPAATSCHIPCRGSLFSSTLKAKFGGVCYMDNLLQLVAVAVPRNYLPQLSSPCWVCHQSCC